MRYDIIIKDIDTVYTLSQGNIPRIRNELNGLSPLSCVSIAIKDGKIAKVGKIIDDEANNILDGKNSIAIPGFVDCHTHTIFGGNRANEWLRRLKGESYLSILKSGGGIIDTVNQTRELQRYQMLEETNVKLDRMLKSGTTTVEIKSGYGLDHNTEIRMLEVANELNKYNKYDIISTYMGAHAIPPEYRNDREGYIKLVIDNLDEIKEKRLATFVDIFCEEGAFTIDESRKILEKAKMLGFSIRLHADELARSGGAILAGELKARSADHLLTIDIEGIDAMFEGNVSAVLLPGTAYQMRSKNIPPVRSMIDKGLVIAVASDFNPGSCPIYSMSVILSFAVSLYGLSPEEALTASTINSAYVLGIDAKKGSIEVGKDADILLLDMQSIEEIPYWFNDLHLKYIIKNGIILNNEGDLI
jgi:imidazolonepropionase